MWGEGLESEPQFLYRRIRVNPLAELDEVLQPSNALGLPERASISESIHESPEAAR